ncbi:hypothetical protein C7964_11918 [Loktanella sp. PT4BL]|nr:hypothetical protein C7964_11918 [Loktanella sp. PT4BL]
MIWPHPVHRAFATTSPTIAGGLVSASSALTRTDAERPHAQVSLSTWLWIVDNLVPSLFNIAAPFDWRGSVTVLNANLLIFDLAGQGGALKCPLPEK